MKMVGDIKKWSKNREIEIFYAGLCWFHTGTLNEKVNATGAKILQS